MTSASESKIRELIWQYPEQEGQPFLLWDEGVEIGWLAVSRGAGRFYRRVQGTKMGIPLQRHAAPARHGAPGGFSRSVVAEYVPCFTGGGMVSFDSGVALPLEEGECLGRQVVLPSCRNRSHPCACRKRPAR